MEKQKRRDNGKGILEFNGKNTTYLKPYEYIQSEFNQYTLEMQYDGNLVCYVCEIYFILMIKNQILLIWKN